MCVVGGVVVLLLGEGYVVSVFYNFGGWRDCGVEIHGGVGGQRHAKGFYSV